MTTALAVRIPDRLSDILNWGPSYHERKNAILYNYKKSTEHYLICGKLLCDADRGKDFRHDGSCAANFYQWVERELGIKRTQAQRMMAIWSSVKGLVQEHIDLILDVDFSKLALIAPHLIEMDEEKQIDLLHMAHSNTAKDVEQNIKEMKGGITHDSCNHDGTFEMYRKCMLCGKFERQ